MKEKNKIKQELHTIEKTYGNNQRYETEKNILCALKDQELLIPKIIKYQENKIIMERINGISLLEVLLDFEEKQNIKSAVEILEKTAIWFKEYYQLIEEKTGQKLSKGDCSPKNFIVSDGKIWGIDFEEAKEDDREQDVIDFFGYYLSFTPINSKFKQEVIKNTKTFFFQVDNFEEKLKVKAEEININRKLKNYNITCSILSGGKATRMNGKNKGQLKIKEKTFIQIIEEKLDFADKIIMSTANTDSKNQKSDIIKNIGPLGGIYSVLSTVNNDRVLFTPCDMPFIKQETYKKLLYTSYMKNSDIVISKDSEGNLNPLVAVYKNTCINIIKEMIDKKDYKVRNIFPYVKVDTVTVTSEELININSEQEYKKIIGGK